jgi:hypothetical protein
MDDSQLLERSNEIKCANQICNLIVYQLKRDKAVPMHTMKAHGKAKLRLFLSLVVDGCDLSALHPAALPACVWVF